MKVLHSCLVICVILAGCSRRPETEPGKAAAKSVEPTPVRVVPAETRKVDKAIFVTGSLMPDETVTVSAEVAGRVSAIFADFGQNVRKGQVLARLDPAHARHKPGKIARVSQRVKAICWYLGVAPTI